MLSLKQVFGSKSGTGFIKREVFYQIFPDYKGKIRIWRIDDNYIRPQSFYFDCRHIIHTHTLHILFNKIEDYNLY